MDWLGGVLQEADWLGGVLKEADWLGGVLKEAAGVYAQGAGAT